MSVQELSGPLFFCFFFMGFVSMSVKLSGPFIYLFIFDEFCFLWQLLLDRCIMHQVYTSEIWD